MKEALTKILSAQVICFAIMAIIWLMVSNPFNINACSEKTVRLPSDFYCRASGEDSFTCFLKQEASNEK